MNIQSSWWPAMLMISGCATAPGSGMEAPVVTDDAEAQERYYLIDHVLPGNHCGDRRTPTRPLPPLSTIVDSTAVARAASRVSETRGFVVFSLAMDSSRVSRIIPIATDLPTQVVDSLAEIVEERRLNAGERDWGGRLRIDVGPSPSIRVGYSTACQPELVNRSEVAAAVAARAARLSSGDFETVPGARGERLMPRRVVSRYFVEPEGSVGRTALVQSSGVRSVDVLAQEIAPLMRFRPGVVDGVAVGLWISFPLTVNPPRRR